MVIEGAGPLLARTQIDSAREKNRTPGGRAVIERSGRAQLLRFERVVVAAFFLVFLDPAIELVRERVDGGVHVRLDGIRVNGASAQQNRGFRFVAQLLDREDAVNVYDPVRMSDDAVQFLFYVILERGRDIDMVTSDVQLHGASSSA
jgi:hypothetical protein